MREREEEMEYTQSPKNDRFWAITPTEHEWRTLLVDLEAFVPRPDHVPQRGRAEEILQ